MIVVKSGEVTAASETFSVSLPQHFNESYLTLRYVSVNSSGYARIFTQKQWNGTWRCHTFNRFLQNKRRCLLTLSSAFMWRDREDLALKINTTPAYGLTNTQYTPNVWVKTLHLLGVWIINLLNVLLMTLSLTELPQEVSIEHYEQLKCFKYEIKHDICTIVKINQSCHLLCVGRTRFDIGENRTVCDSCYIHTEHASQHLFGSSGETR